MRNRPTSAPTAEFEANLEKEEEEEARPKSAPAEHLQLTAEEEEGIVKIQALVVYPVCLPL
jgi:hypothetical protein